MKVLRYITIIVLIGGFSWLAWDLYQKQHKNYHFTSFSLPQQSAAVFIPDINRLIRKVNYADIEQVISGNPSLLSGFNQFKEHSGVDFNQIFGNAVYVSFTATDISLAFQNPDLEISDFTSVLDTVFKQKASVTETGFELAGQMYYAEKFNAFYRLTTTDFTPINQSDSLLQTNADFVVLKENSFAERFILENKQQYRIVSHQADTVRGNPIQHESFFRFVPMDFDAVFLYGSERLRDDKRTFFNQPENEGYSWVADGMMVLKKDSFELVLAPQNDQRDLKLILEEQTLKQLGDTLPINYIKLKSFLLMPFRSTINWQEQIPGLSDQLTFYTEYENFNVMANSYAAMRWFLSKLQTGDLFLKEMEMQERFDLSVPLKVHYMHIQPDTGQSLAWLIESSVWNDYTRKSTTQAFLSLQEKQMDDVADQMVTAELDFEPTFILPYQDKKENKALVASANAIGIIAESGEINWQKKYAEKIIGNPQLIDLENDGKHEIIVLTEKKLEILTASGKVSGNRSINLPESAKMLLTVNYDQKFNYRFFLVLNQTVACYNEELKIVEGWKFEKALAPLQAKGTHTLINGKDYLCFADDNGKLYVVNRRGEDRFANAIPVNLPYESDFIIGEDENNIRKLGYRNQYIINHYLKGNYRDSIKLDKRVNAIDANWLQADQTYLMIEEPGRVLIFNAFGYVENEVLKPQGAEELVGVTNDNGFNFVFFNYNNNRLYLLKNDGKLMLPNQITSGKTYGMTADLFYTADGKKIKRYKLN